MAGLTTKEKLIINMDPEEIREHLRPEAEKLKQIALDNGAWYSFKNELCNSSDLFIHEYRDGKKELVQLNAKTGEYAVLKAV